jgi:hypothetical protein
MKPRKVLVWTLITPVLILGCNKKEIAQSQLPPQNVVFDIEGDPGFSASIEHPGQPSPKDGKFHYRISIRNLNPITSQRLPVGVGSSAQSEIAGEARVPIAASEMGTRPEGALVVETRPEPTSTWEEAYGKPSVQGATVIDLANGTSQGSAWAKVEGACRLDGTIECWDVAGKPDATLTADVSKWYSGQQAAFYKAKEFNRLVAFSKVLNLSWGSSPNSLGLENESTETTFTDNHTLFLAKVKSSVVDMPVHFTFNRPNGKSSAWFEVPVTGSVKVGEYLVSRKKAPEYPGSGIRHLVLDIKPRPQSSFYFSARASQSGPEEVRHGYFGADGYLIQQMGLEEIRWLKFDFNDSQSVLWEHIPLRARG